MVNLPEVFEKYDDEYRKFERVENKLHPKREICAFLLLDRLLPTTDSGMVCAAETDELFLAADCKKLAEVATDNDILTLIRCGVHYDSRTDSLAMFV